MFTSKYIVFLCPDPSHPSINWDWYVLSTKWDLFIISMFILSFIALTWFYFFHKPTPNASRTFWLFSIIFIIIGAIIAYIYMKNNKDVLFIENINWTFEHTLVVLISGLVTSIMAYFFSFIFFIFLSQIPTTWHIRAMRRYPFKFIK